MWTNYRVVAVDNLLEGRTWVAKQNSIQTSINGCKHNSWAMNVRWGGPPKRSYLVSMQNTTIHDNQLSTLWLNKSVMTKSKCVEEDFVLAWRIWREKPTRNDACVLADNYQLIFLNQLNATKLNPNFHQWYKHNSRANNVRWGGRTLSRVNAEYDYSWQSTLKLWLNKNVMTKSGYVEEDFVMHEITDNKSILQKQPEYRSA